MMMASSFMRRVEAASIQWTRPARSAQLGEDLGGVVAALGRDDDVALFQCVNVVRVLQGGFVLRLRRGLAAGVGGGKEHGLDEAEVTFCLHAVHQDRAHHAAPTDEAYEISNLAHHYRPFRKVIWFPRLVWAGEGA
jgi:hypothetical protein